MEWRKIKTGDSSQGAVKAHPKSPEQLRATLFYFRGQSLECSFFLSFTYSTVPTRYRYNLIQGGLLHHVNRAGKFWNAKSRRNEIHQNFKSNFFCPNGGEGGNVVRERQTLFRQEALCSFFFRPKQSAGLKSRRKSGELKIKSTKGPPLSVFGNKMHTDIEILTKSNAITSFKNIRFQNHPEIPRVTWGRLYLIKRFSGCIE